MSVLVVLITAPNEEAAADLGRTLVEEQLAACVNLVPRIRSIYRWEGKLEDDAETLMIVKTRRALLERLTERAVELHPYTVPEVVGCEVVGGNEKYLDWVRTETGGSDASA